MPDRTVADFYIRYPDAVYLAQETEMVDNAARAAALGTGTKVKIDHYGQLRDGISTGTLAELGFAYMKKFGATNVQPDPGKPQGFEETGSVSSEVPGSASPRRPRSAPNHTYEMLADATAPIGHHGFVVDAQAMSALLYDFATHAEYRAAVKTEFETIRGLKARYLDELTKVYVVPKVPDPQ